MANRCDARTAVRRAWSGWMAALLVAGVGLLSGPGQAGAAATFPDRPIRMLVGSVAGGTTDLVARAIAPKMSEILGQQVIVDDRPGANQMIAAQLTAQAAPDGYTILMIPAGFAINPALYKKLAFDPVKDFTPIARVADAPNVLVVHPSVPARSVKQFVALLQAKPGTYSFGSSGVGSPSHMSGAMFELLTHTTATHVPYKGSGPAMTDLLGGHLQFSFPSIPGAIAYIKSGQLIALGVTGKQRSLALPEVPTIEQAGVPGYNVGSWFGVAGPAHLPPEVVATLNRAVRQTLATPQVREVLMHEGAEPSDGGTPQGFAREIASDMAKWVQVVKSAGIQPQ